MHAAHSISGQKRGVKYIGTTMRPLCSPSVSCTPTPGPAPMKHIYSSLTCAEMHSGFVQVTPLSKLLARYIYEVRYSVKPPSPVRMLPTFFSPTRTSKFSSTRYSVARSLSKSLPSFSSDSLRLPCMTICLPFLSKPVPRRLLRMPTPAGVWLYSISSVPFCRSKTRQGSIAADEWAMSSPHSLTAKCMSVHDSPLSNERQITFSMRLGLSLPP